MGRTLIIENAAIFKYSIHITPTAVYYELSLPNLIQFPKYDIKEMSAWHSS